MWSNWRLSLAPEAPVWRGLVEAGGVTSVAELPELRRLGRAALHDSLIIALRERAIRSCPPVGWRLMPSRAALQVLGDKALFARFAAAQGLAAHVPGHGNGGFPLVLKRRRSFGGRGTVVVHSAAELRRRRWRAPWLLRPVLVQEVVAGRDHVLHGICRNGRLVWHCAHTCDLAAGELIQRPGNVVACERHAATAEEISLFERFLRPLGYDGPVAIDYKRDADGRVVVLEVNPRFGGSLMRPEHSHLLHSALAALILHARPPGDLQG